MPRENPPTGGASDRGRATWAQRKPVLLSSDTEEQLRALGYIE